MELNHKLPKSEILRGFRAFSKVLNSSLNYSINNVRVFVKIEKDNKDNNEDINNLENKLPYSSIKFGVLVSKKKIPKATKRNRLKRLIREAYRLNKSILSKISTENIKVALIFSLTEVGYERFNSNKNFKMQLLYDDIKFLLQKVIKYINKGLID